MGDMADAALDECMDEVYDEETDTFFDGWSRRKWEQILRGGGPCPRCNGPTTKKTGRHGPFYGCTAYPQCTGSRFAYEWEIEEWEFKWQKTWEQREIAELEQMMSEAADDLHDLQLRQSRQNHGASTVSDYTPRPGSFTLFRNRFKEPGDKKPDYTGNGAGLDGQPLQIAGWIKEGKSGEKFMSIAISEPQPKADAFPPAAEPSDDCPF